MNNAAMPAYPMSEEDSIKWLQGGSVLAGITKQEHFTGLAMQSLISNLTLDNLDSGTIDWIVRKAATIANRQLAELE
jgi:hypothetical protein